jgi:hypothetical protein
LSKRRITYDSSQYNTVLGGNMRLLTLNHISSKIKNKDLAKEIKTAQDKLGIDNEMMLNNSLAIFTELQNSKEISNEWIQDTNELSEDEKQAFVLIDNVNDGEWDFDILANEWEIDTYDWGIVDWKIDEEPEVDYSILDNENDLDGLMSNMTNNVKKAIQIEFDLDDYEPAYELVKFWREQGNVGKMILNFLQSEKDKL